MKRSASTFQYNLLVSAFLLAGFEVWRGGRIAYHNTSPDLGTLGAYVVKSHPYDSRLAEDATHVFTSYRPPAHTRKSYEDAFDEPVGATEQKKWYDWFGRWQEHSDYLMMYDELVQRGGALREIHRHIAQLRISPSPKQVAMVTASRMEPPSNEKDPDTLVFPDHYTSHSFTDTLPQYADPTHAHD